MKLIFEGQQCLKEYLRLIKNAKETIYISMYIIKPDFTSKLIFDALEEKYRSGVDVRLMYDYYGCWKAYIFLKKYEWAIPYSRSINRRLHAKIMIVDRKVGIVSGRNFADEYFNEWHDTSVILEKKSEIRELVHFWDHVNIGFPLVNNSLKFTSENQFEIYDVVVSNIQAAKTEILIVSPYFVIDDVLRNELLAACNRGVKVTVITPLRMENGIMEIFNRLNFHKVEHKNFQTYHTNSMFHSKIMVMDKQGLIGSANFDLRSFKINFEACVPLSARHIAAIMDHSQVLKQRDAKYSRFTRRLDAFLEFIFRPIMPLL